MVRTWFKGWTIIAIAHKLETILDFDMVAVLDDGKLIEFDNPTTLLTQNSAFRELYENSPRRTGRQTDTPPPETGESS